MMKIKEVMSSKIDIVSPDAKLAEVAKQMRDDDIGALPIVQNDEVIGMITDRDIVVRSVAEGRDGAATAARDAMSPELVVCSEDESVDDVANRMAQAKVRRIPVLDKNDRLVGIVSLGDLSRTAGADAGEALRKVSEPTSSARAL